MQKLRKPKYRTTVCAVGVLGYEAFQMSSITSQPRKKSVLCTPNKPVKGNENKTTFRFYNQQNLIFSILSKEYRRHRLTASNSKIRKKKHKNNTMTFLCRFKAWNNPNKRNRRTNWIGGGTGSQKQKLSLSAIYPSWAFEWEGQ